MFEIVNHLPDSLFEIIPSYRSKDSFGDLDVPRESLKNCISPADFVYNASFAIESLDKITTS